MTARDVFRFINDLDDTALQSLVSRLEFRGKDERFVRWRNEYLDCLDLASSARVLDIGCGTGVVTRGIAARPGFTGQIVGQDHSPRLIEAARGLAAEEGLADRITFEVGDAHSLPYADASFDIAIAHTTISHVGDPLSLLKEGARVVKPGGRVAIFDGDYASWTFDHPDPVVARTMDEAMIGAIVNNPRVLREMPRLLGQAGLDRQEVLAWIYADVGPGGFFRNSIEVFAPIVKRSGLVRTDQVDDWIAYQQRAMARGEFFSACNYYAYIATRL
jgi:ubiquinone/menaquinone biosynthesis C-methylase UbiE